MECKRGRRERERVRREGEGEMERERGREGEGDLHINALLKVAIPREIDYLLDLFVPVTIDFWPLS
jgi:hypothetical protein